MAVEWTKLAFSDDLHAPVTIDGTSPLSLSTQALSLKNDADAAITEVDTGTLANSDTMIPTSKAVKTYVDKRAVYYSSDYANLAAFVTAIGATECALVINRDEAVAADTTLPATVAVTVLKGCVITVATGVTLTINGSFNCGLYQAFSCTGTGAVVFGTGAVDAVYPEWWGADGTGVVAASTIFAKMVASGCNQIRLVPGAIYRIKDVALPAESYFKIDGQWGKIVADGTDGSPATSCFTITFNDGAYHEYWEMENVIHDHATIGGTAYGYFTDFLVVTLAETGTMLVDLHIKNIHAHGGRAGATTPANSVIKIINDGAMSPENIDINNIYAQDNILVKSVVYMTNNSGSSAIGSMNVKEIFHAAPDTAVKVIYNVDMIVQNSSFDMIYSGGGTIISMYDCRHSRFSRIYEESMIAGINTCMAGKYIDCIMDHIHQTQALTPYSTIFDDTTGWAAGHESTIAAIAGGVIGNCLKVIASGETYAGSAYHDVTTVVGAKYSLSVYFKKGTADGGKVLIGTVGAPTSIWESDALTDADWAKKTKVFTATETTTRITLQSNDADATEYSLFDSLYVDCMDMLITGAPLIGCTLSNLFHYTERGLLDHKTVTLDANSYDNTIISLGDPQGPNYKAWENISDLGTNNTLPLDAVGTFVKAETRALDGESGDVSYTGYGFRPKSLIIYACMAGTTRASWGMVSNALTELCTFSYGAAAIFGVSAKIVDIVENASPNTRQTAIVKSLDADGFTLTWTRTGATSAGTIFMRVMASDR